MTTSNKQKPREFWINPKTGYITEALSEYGKWQKRNGKPFERVHVVEVSALDELQQKLAKAVAALKLIADTYYDHKQSSQDMANSALKDLGESEVGEG